MTEVLDIAPIDAIYALSEEAMNHFGGDMVPARLRTQAIDLKIHWVSETGKDPIRLTSGIRMLPTVSLARMMYKEECLLRRENPHSQDSYENCPPLDVVLMGAQIEAYQPSEADLAFIRKSYEDCSAFLTICGGMMSPMQAGIFQGKSATGPRMMLDSLREKNPGVDWQEKRWVRDGKLWSSGTLLNGLDLMHAFCTETWGGEGSLVEFHMNLTSWPRRDVDYKDEPKFS